MRHISSALRKVIIERAGNRCEYCSLSQAGQAATFHVDHVLPIAEGGPTTEANLALACVSCSLRKSARLSAFDPQTNQEVAIFNPRNQIWIEHFRWEGVVIVGMTATGRATVAALKMNRPVILAISEEEIILDRHPPQANP